MNEANDKLPTGHGFTAARGSAKLCLKPNCGKVATSRGLCPSCYRVARMLVKEHKTTWEKLEQTGRCKAAQYCRESSTRDWMLCLDSDGGHIHELHANDTLSPNEKLCHAADGDGGAQKGQSK